MFQKSVLNSIKQDESQIALRWSAYQSFLAKVDYIKTQKEEKYQDGFLRDIFENCLGYTLDMTDPANFNLECEKKNETDSKKADAVIYVNQKIVGVIELKAQDTKNLDKIESQINKTDKEIDQMVYKIYDLTDDEIKIVEGV